MLMIRGCCVIVSVQDPALIVETARVLCCWCCGSVYARACARPGCSNGGHSVRQPTPILSPGVKAICVYIEDSVAGTGSTAAQHCLARMQVAAEWHTAQAQTAPVEVRAPGVSQCRRSDSSRRRRRRSKPGRRAAPAATAGWATEAAATWAHRGGASEQASALEHLLQSCRAAHGQIQPDRGKPQRTWSEQNICAPPHTPALTIFGLRVDKVYWSGRRAGYASVQAFGGMAGVMDHCALRVLMLCLNRVSSTKQRGRLCRRRLTGALTAG